MPSVRSALRAFAAVGASTVIGQVIGFLALAYVARRVGPADLGDYNFAVSVVGAFALVNVGIGVLGIRDIAAAPDRARPVATETTALLTAFNALALAGILLAAPLIAPSQAAADLLRILAFTFLTSGLSFEWALIGLGRFRLVAIGRVAGQVLYAVLVFLLLRRGTTAIAGYAVFNLAGYALTALVSAGAFFSSAGLARPPAGLVPRLGRRLRRSLDIGYPLAVMQLYLTIDVILLGYVGTARQTGEYAVASRLPLALTSLTIVWGSVLFPHITRTQAAGLRDLTRELGRAVTLVLAAGAVLVAGAAILAAPVMTLCFGDAYADAGPTFVVLSAVAILLLADITLGNALLARGRERQYARAVTAALIVNALLDLALIPAAGALGPAVATLAVEAGVFLFFVARVSAHLGPVPIAWTLVRRSLLTSAAAAGALVVLAPDAILLRVLLFLAAFLAAGLLTGLGRRSVWSAAWNAT
jgi:O-antigen/teichoic acid export membrane protein